MTDDELLALRNAVARSVLEDVIAEIDVSPAVLWAGVGGVKERMLKIRDEYT